MNVVVLKGRLTGDPVVHPYGDGQSVLRFGLAVRREFKKENGPEADFFNCVYFGKGQNLINRKGQELVIDGRIENNDWLDNQGNKRRDYQIKVEGFDLCGPKPDSAPPTPAPAQSEAEYILPEDLPEDDVPF